MIIIRMTSRLFIDAYSCGILASNNLKIRLYGFREHEEAYHNLILRRVHSFLQFDHYRTVIVNYKSSKIHVLFCLRMENCDVTSTLFDITQRSCRN